jgi:hypothetical protein
MSMKKTRSKISPEIMKGEEAIGNIIVSRWNKSDCYAKVRSFSCRDKPFVVMSKGDFLSLGDYMGWLDGNKVRMMGDFR